MKTDLPPSSSNRELRRATQRSSGGGTFWNKIRNQFNTCKTEQQFNRIIRRIRKLKTT